MKATIFIELAFLAALATARPLSGSSRKLVAREVPQEHSHQKILTSVSTSLNLNNPAKIADPVFSLLGNKAAAAGAGSITDLDCLQQAVADQAFTNAKAKSDVQGMTDALIFRALERNTGAVGNTSTLCTSVKAVNPEIAALQQHQDPASPGAAATNKKIALNLAVQIASIGGNPQDALQSGTFAPGTIGDPTAAGKTCDDATDTEGCIFSKNLLVADATAEEINAAVSSAGISVNAAATSTAAAVAAASSNARAAPATVTVTVFASSAAVAVATSAKARSANAAVTTATAVAAAAAASSSSASTTPSTSSLNLGTCAGSSPFILFGAGFDGRTENSFEPADEAKFNHGSALKINVVASFICQRLADSCNAPQATVDACNSGASAAASATGQAAADAFNKALA